MSKVKGRYVATVVMDFEYRENPSTRPFDEVKSAIVGGDLTKAIHRTIADEIFDENMGTLKVEQQYADLYKVEQGNI